MTRYKTYSYQETAAAGRALAESLAPRRDRARLVFLSGDLGAGKTTFCQGFLRGLGVRGRITSPTFVLLKKYSLKNKKFETALHLDCYRLRSGDDLKPLAINKAQRDPANVILIEWPEIAWRRAPAGAIRVFFRHGRSSDEREIIISK